MGQHYSEEISMYQFFVDDCQIGKEYVTITGSDVNHIKNVLRMKTGDKVYLSNGSDLEYECSLLEWTDDTILAKIEDVHGMETELPVKITLYQGLPKGDKMEMIVQKAVDLGVAEIVPVAMKRCVVKLDAKKAAKKVSPNSCSNASTFRYARPCFLELSSK